MRPSRSHSDNVSPGLRHLIHGHPAGTTPPPAPSPGQKPTRPAPAKAEIPNLKSEIRNKQTNSEVQNLQRTPRPTLSPLVFSSFRPWSVCPFVSDFELRISDFPSSGVPASSLYRRAVPTPSCLRAFPSKPQIPNPKSEIRNKKTNSKRQNLKRNPRPAVFPRPSPFRHSSFELRI